MIKVAVLGSAGRMGKALIKGIADSKSLALCSAIDKPGLKLPLGLFELRASSVFS